MSMGQLSITPSERARKAHAKVLQALAEPGTQKTLATVMGTSETTISRIKTEKLEDAITLIAHLGFKVVPGDMQCFPADYVQALHTMAKLQIQQAAPTLDWEN